MILRAKTICWEILEKEGIDPALNVMNATNVDFSSDHNYLKYYKQQVHRQGASLLQKVYEIFRDDADILAPKDPYRREYSKDPGIIDRYFGVKPFQEDKNEMSADGMRLLQRMILFNIEDVSGLAFVDLRVTRLFLRQAIKVDKRFRRFVNKNKSAYGYYVIDQNKTEKMFQALLEVFRGFFGEDGLLPAPVVIGKLTMQTASTDLFI